MKNKMIRRTIRRVVIKKGGAYDTRAIISCISKSFHISKQSAASHVRWYRDLGAGRAGIEIIIPHSRSDAMYV